MFNAIARNQKNRWSAEGHDRVERAAIIGGHHDDPQRLQALGHQQGKWRGSVLPREALLIFDVKGIDIHLLRH
jgi:hypothetical protein